MLPHNVAINDIHFKINSKPPNITHTHDDKLHIIKNVNKIHNMAN